MKAIFLDIETTGLDPLIHQPIDIALKVINICDGKLMGQYQSLIYQTKDAWEDHDPVSLEINGYRWGDVANGKPKSLIKSEIIQLFGQLGIQRGKAVFLCQNPAFDRSFFIRIIDVYTQERLLWPYHWLDLASMYWALLTKYQTERNESFPEELCLSKNSIAESYNLPQEEYPHRAMQGVDHLIQCYYTVLKQGGRR